MEKSGNNKILEWFEKEGALAREGNLYLAPRIFVANSIITWIKKKPVALKQEEIEYIMNMLRLFLQNKVDLKWEGDKIEIMKSINESADNKFGTG